MYLLFLLSSERLFLLLQTFSLTRLAVKELTWSVFQTWVLWVKDSYWYSQYWCLSVPNHHRHRLSSSIDLSCQQLHKPRQSTIEFSKLCLSCLEGLFGSLWYSSTAYREGYHLHNSSSLFCVSSLSSVSSCHTSLTSRSNLKWEDTFTDHPVLDLVDEVSACVVLSLQRAIYWVQPVSASSSTDLFRPESCSSSQLH